MEKEQSVTLPVKDSKTADGFRNLAMKLGIAAPGDEGCEGGNQISFGRYQFNPLTRNRIQLEAAYRGSWIVGRVVDCVAEDMTKAGVIMTTNDGADRLQDFKVQFSRLQIWQRVRDTTAWGRLYGGSIGVFQIEGQDLSSPLDPETIGEGQFLGIAVYDRWQLQPVLSDIIESGPDIGLPAYYDIVLGSNMNDPGQVPGASSQNNVGVTGASTENMFTNRRRVHHTRCFRMGGHKLPFFQAITEMMWDESIIERMWDRLIEFETATAQAGGLIGRALLRTVKLEKFRETLAAGGEVKQGMLEMFEYMRMFQNSEGLTLLDKEDDFSTVAYSFAGLSDILERFGEQLSGASEIPLVRLFGQTPGGLNSNGEQDIRNYYDSINSKQENYLRNPVEMIIKILWRSTFGEAAPKDLSFIFTPLWQMSAKDKAEITQLNTNSIILAHDNGLVDSATAMKELKQASADTGVFTHITDDKIQEAENELPPEPDMDPAEPEESAGTGDPGEGPAKPKKGAKDSVWRKWFGKAVERHKPVSRHKTADQKAIEKWLKKSL